MAKLTDDMRLFIVRGLACFDTPTMVARDVEATFHIKVEADQVRQYAPDWGGKPPAKRWVKLYEEVRKAFIEKQAGIAIAEVSMRLRRLERVVNGAEARGNQDMVLRGLEQAAKEQGGFFTNKLKVSGQVSGTIQYKRVDTGIDRNA